ncbi:MAG: cholesterol oxidase, partial [Streptomyces sp.]|nr:cholesterol oxidase [Streptomyces sp.]
MGDGPAVTSARTCVLAARGRRRLTARHVISTAGPLGTQSCCTPGERVADYSRGAAITSSVHLDDTTHIEPVRYGRGGNLLGLLD